MQGSDVREIWARIIKLEKKVAALEIEDENYEILGTFAVSSSDGDDTSVEERTIDDYTEDDDAAAHLN